MQSAAVRGESKSYARSPATERADVREVGGFACLHPKAGADLGPFAPHSAYLVLQFSGRSAWRRAGRDVTLRAGEAVLIDGAAGQAVEPGAPGACFCLQIPRELVAAHFRRPPESPIRGAPAALLGALVRSAFDNAGELEPEQALAVREALLGLIAACWGGPAGRVVELADLSEADEPALMRQVKAYILQNLENPALSPPLIARAQGMSVRHLHRLFKAGGVSLGDWIRQRRLAHCAADLADSAHDDESLTEIAFRWGFSDSAHFSRSFRAQYDVSPRAYRAGRKTPSPAGLGANPFGGGRLCS